MTIYGQQAKKGGGPTIEPKVYKALISQSGASAPVATVLKNTIGDIVWSYDGAGAYIGTLVGAFPEGKTLLFIGNEPTFDNVSLSVLGLSRGSDDYVYLNGQRFSANTSTGAITQIQINDLITNTLSIAIEVYP
jgi:hypothetical protein